MTDTTNTKKSAQTSRHSAAAEAESAAVAIAPKKQTKAETRRRAQPKGAKEKPATKEEKPPKLAVPSEPRQTKAATVEAMLCRKEGASLGAICTATGWQAHTCRAFLTGLRKKGKEVIRDKDKDGTTIYRIEPAEPANASA
mgnify:CR=1 FL=1|tara:strand:+ start:4976 stop:5398 length:423 start_codon:yes stop_codon:yes gene_type:complete